MTMYIFPGISIERKDDLFTLQTTLRKKFDGKYYLKDFTETYKISVRHIDERCIMDISNRFLMYVYTHMLYSLKDHDCVLDEDQRYEGDRIIGYSTLGKVKHVLSNYEV